jgi:tagatose 6-phosphate kinase
MITTVTLNAAIDKTYYLNGFMLGHVNRVKEMRAIPGGKGINVARVIQQLGYNSFITGFAGGSNGQYIRSALAKQGLQFSFVEVLGESRINLNIIDQGKLTSTEILEQGPSIEKDQLEKMMDFLQAASRNSSVIVFSGSLPPGVPTDFYRSLIEVVKSEGAIAILDTSGEALLEGLKAKPFMIKPNEEELQAITGHKIMNEAELMDCIEQLMKQDIPCVVVSLGAKGAVVGYEGKLYRVHAPKTQAVNPVGSGDSFMAGFAIALENGFPIQTCLLMATASGTANVMTAEAGNIRLEDYERFLTLASVEKINKFPSDTLSI